MMSAYGKVILTGLAALTFILQAAENCSSRVKELELDREDFSCLEACYLKTTDLFGGLDDSCREACRNHCNSHVDFSFFFSNGMLTEWREADKGLREALDAFRSEMKLKQPGILDQLNVSPKLAYNQSHGFIGDFATSAFQRMTALESEMFFYFLRHLDKAPGWFRDLFAERLKDWIRTEHETTVILRKSAEQMLRKYYEILKGPRPGMALVVTHSQGNLFFSNLVPLLKTELEKGASNHFASFIKENDIIPNLSAVQTALPIYEAHGINQAVGRHGLPRYFNLKSDGFMKFLAPLAPPPTVDNKTGGYFEHFFSEHYLRGKNSGPAIRQAMVLETCWMYISLFDPYDHNDTWGFARTDEDGYCSF